MKRRRYTGRVEVRKLGRGTSQSRIAWINADLPSLGFGE